MDQTVITKLSDIETAARQIMDDAARTIQELDAGMQQRYDAFDAEVEADTARRLEELRETLQRENSAALQKLEDDVEERRARSFRAYEEQHGILTDRIVRKITGV